MTNEEFLADKFCMSKYVSMKDLFEDKSAYLLKQVEWMQENWVESWEQPSGCTTVRCNPSEFHSFQATGSCILEAIENAQEEMNNV